MLQHAWPGNVRELENLIERLTVLRGEGEIRIEDLPAGLRQPERPEVPVPPIPEGGLSLRDVVDDFETRLILKALEQTGWNQTQSAALLGMNRTTLIEKMKKKGLRAAQAE
jgi:DNA-binding NtrC family response regulator